MAIQFLKGTSASFNAQDFTPVSDVFYLLTDTNDFYLGSVKLSNASDLAVAVANIAANAEDIAAINAKLVKLENTEETDGSIRNIIRGYLDGDVATELAKKTDKELTGANGKALIFNESDGGGAKFEHKDGTMSFVGVNDGGENGITGQLYSVKKDSETGKNIGTRLNMTTEGFFYTNGNNSAAYTAADEIATKGDVAGASGNANSKTIYLKDETAGQSEYAKVYHFYQGADAVDMSKNSDIGVINLAKDLVVSGGKVVTVASEVDSDGDQAPGLVDGTYIKLFVQNQDEALYINVLDLVNDFTVEENAQQIQLEISATREISATIVDGSVGTDSLSDGAITAAKLSNSAKALFDEAGAADAVLGDPSDSAGDATVFGALAAAEAAVLTWGAF